MANFEVLIQQITIEPHPNADALELAKIGEYRSVVKKDLYRTGDLVAYIPEAAVLPDWLLKAQGFWKEEKQCGTLAGSKGNRVKAISLRSIISQGIVIPTISNGMGDFVFLNNYNPDSDAVGYYVTEGQDVADYLGITKYEPPVPTQLAGEVCNLFGYTLDFDIENYKKYPDVIQECEEITLTEKIHGSYCSLAYFPGLNHPEVLEGDYFANSKGLGSQGLVFKDNERNANNVYLTTLKKYKQLVKQVSEMYEDMPVFVLGEVFGNVQDLKYGFNNEVQFRVFDIYIGAPSTGYYLDNDAMMKVCDQVGFPRVPLLYRGPFSREILKEYTSGKEQVSGKEVHIREGVVINVIPERRDNRIGRVILKSVSDEYLTRKNKDATEYY